MLEIIKRINFRNKYIFTFENILIILFFGSLFWPINLTNISSLLNSESLISKIPFDISDRTFAFHIQIIIIISYISNFIRKNITLYLNTISKLILGLLGYSLTLNVFYFQSLDYIISMDYYYKYFFNISTAIIIFNYLKNNKLLINVILQLLVYLSVILSLQIIFGIFSVTNVQSQRITLIGWKENELSLLISIGYAILTSIICDKKYFNYIVPLLHISFSLILVNAILFIGTRASIIVVGFILIIIFLSLLKKPLNRNQKIMLLVTNVTYYISKTTSYEPITERFFKDNFTSLGGRAEHWFNTLKWANENSPFGIGIENYISKMFELSKIYSVDGFIRNAGEGFFRIGMPENLILEVYVTAGFFALSLISLIIFYMYLKAYYVYLKTKKLELLIWLTPLLSSILVLKIRHIKVFFAFFSLYLIKDFIYQKKLNIKNKNLFFISRTFNK